MNILIIVDTYLSLSETFIYNQIQGLKAAKKIILCHKLDNEELYPIDIAVYQVNSIPIGIINKICSLIIRTLNKSGKYTYPFDSILEIKKIIMEEKIDLIYAHYGNNGVKILPIARFFKIPLVVIFHGYDASKLLKDREYCSLLKRLFRYKTQTILVSKSMANNLEPFGLSSGNFKYIPYGINLSKFSLSERKSQNLIKLIHTGRITPKKGVLDLLKVIKEIKELKDIFFHLEILGEGEDYSEAIKYVNENNLKNHVTFWGAQPHFKLINLLKEADIFILNSRISDEGDTEGFPNAILEAMACGVPVISTYHAGIPDIIDHRINGILVNEKDNFALKNAILELIENTELRQMLAKNGKLKAIENFSADKMNMEINSYISTLNNPELTLGN